jgi:hypothetical protein
MTGAANVEFTEYALLRMHQRDILREEVTLVLARRAQHKRRKDGRSEVRGRVPGRRNLLLVIYRRTDDTIVVINAMWE